MPKLKTAQDLEVLRAAVQRERARFSVTITICGGTGCQASQSPSVVQALKQELKAQGLEKRVWVRTSGCHGFCEQGPLMVIEPSHIFYCHLTPHDVPAIVEHTIRNDQIIEALLYTDPISGRKIQTEAEIPFYRAQDRLLLSQNKLVDPCSIDDFIAVGGYSAISKVLFSMQPEEIIKTITESGLRGRGGGGFVTGRKWAECRAALSDEKYVICNADEGDPGAYMDRSILEGNPHLVLEGMLIGAYGIGAEYGYIYVRKEYPLAVEHARVALQQAREYGLLGERILGSPFSFDVEIARGGGAFVCGESTALMASLEGRVGEPRPKDVHTVEEGLWNKPTTLNNVETWANVPFIINNGASWFAAKGTRNSKGTKILALTGHIRNTGLVEVALGTPLKTVIYDIGGGPVNGKTIKAVQTGGPSGGCLPVSKFDLPIDFDALYEAGSMVGSGGMVVMDDSTCMVDVAKYFLQFLQDESCGKCVPCRLGIDRMLEIITDITEGRGKAEHIALLQELADTVQQTSLCGLGKTAPNPVLSTLRYFPEEYEAHVMQKRCPAKVCKALITFAIAAENCTGCGRCRATCPYGAISGGKKQAHVINPQMCNKCGMCAEECQFQAIVVNS